MSETWPGADERLAVEKMIRDQNSEQWGECFKYVKRCVYSKAKNMPSHLLDDMIQEIMLKIMKYLPYFRFHCALKTWVYLIVRHHIIDEYRKLRNEGTYLSFSVNPIAETDGESQEPNLGEGVSAEESFEIHEKIRMGIAALQEYANTTSNPTRNRHIIQLVLFEGKTYEEAAITIGCNSPVVGYIVREAQRYTRDILRNQS